MGGLLLIHACGKLAASTSLSFAYFLLVLSGSSCNCLMKFPFASDLMLIAQPDFLVGLISQRSLKCFGLVSNYRFSCSL
jgi:hypothetical protein